MQSAADSHATSEQAIVPETLSLFRAALPASRRRLLRSALVRTLPAGASLFEQGEVPSFQIVALSGTVQLLGRSAERREVLIEVVRAPDLVLPAAVAMNAPYLVHGRVPEESRFLLIPAAAFRDAAAADPALAQAVIGALAQQSRRMVRRIKDLTLRSSTQRVGCYLLALSERQRTPDRAVLPYEKSLIASELGIARESFSRALSSLERSGMRVEGQTIVILDRDRLAASCGPDPLIDGDDAP